MICISKFSKEHNSVKNVGGVIVLLLCTLSDYALYLYSFMKISKRVSGLLRGNRCHKIVKGA